MERFVVAAMMGQGGDESVVGDDVPVGHFVEQVDGRGEGAQLGVGFDEAVGEDCVGRRDGSFEKEGVEELGMGEASGGGDA